MSTGSYRPTGDNEMIVRFEYGKEQYKYDSDRGWITKPNPKYPDAVNFETKVCPVFRELFSKKDPLTEDPLDDFRHEDRIYILKAILHGYSFGYDSGASAKAYDIRRALNIPEVL